jgi:hypothetical protein
VELVAAAPLELAPAVPLARGRRAAGACACAVPLELAAAAPQELAPAVPLELVAAALLELAPAVPLELAAGASGRPKVRARRGRACHGGEAKR